MGYLIGRGLFNRELHKVYPTNAARLHGDGRDFALSECGVACVLTSPPWVPPTLLWCIECVSYGSTEEIPMVPPRPSQELMQRVLVGLQRL